MATTRSSGRTERVLAIRDDGAKLIVTDDSGSYETHRGRIERPDGEGREDLVVSLLARGNWRPA